MSLQAQRQAYRLLEIYPKLILSFSIHYSIHILQISLIIYRNSIDYSLIESMSFGSLAQTACITGKINVEPHNLLGN